jgi:hypothetical protein
MHFLGISYSPAWLADHANGIRYDWPRVPLPDSKELLLASAKLGENVALLLDVDTAVPGVTTGTIRPELREIARITSGTRGKPNLTVAAGWGSKDQKGRVNPGQGRIVERAYDPNHEARCVEKAPLLGGDTLNVFLNGDTHWRNVPRSVWETFIGGYQVVKKWLSYHEQTVLGRPLSAAEANYITQICQRLAALLILGPTLDENYRRCAAAHIPMTSAGADVAEQEDLETTR